MHAHVCMCVQGLESSPISNSVCVCAHAHAQYVCARVQCVRVCACVRSVCLCACAVCVCAHSVCACVHSVCLCVGVRVCVQDLESSPISNSVCGCVCVF